MKRISMRHLFFVAASISLSACSQGSGDNKDASSDAAPVKLIEVPVSVAGPGLSLLAAADDFVINLESCASKYKDSYQKSLAGTGDKLEVIEGDTGCVIRVMSVTLNNQVYTQVANGFIYTDSTSGDSLKLKFESNISTPIAASDSVVLSFTQVDKTAQFEGDIPTTKIVPQISGVTAPSVSLNAAGIVFQNLDQGKPVFEITVKCDNGISTHCGADLWADLKYALISGSSAVDFGTLEGLTYASFSSTDITNNSLIIASQSAVDVYDATQDYSMILVVKNTESYKYFNVKIPKKITVPAAPAAP